MYNDVGKQRIERDTITREAKKFLLGSMTESVRCLISSGGHEFESSEKMVNHFIFFFFFFPLFFWGLKMPCLESALLKTVQFSWHLERVLDDSEK